VGAACATGIGEGWHVIERQAYADAIETLDL